MSYISNEKRNITLPLYVFCNVIFLDQFLSLISLQKALEININTFYHPDSNAAYVSLGEQTEELDTESYTEELDTESYTEEMKIKAFSKKKRSPSLTFCLAQFSDEATEEMETKEMKSSSLSNFADEEKEDQFSEETKIKDLSSQMRSSSLAEFSDDETEDQFSEEMKIKAYSTRMRSPSLAKFTDEEAGKIKVLSKQGCSDTCPSLANFSEEEEEELVKIKAFNNMMRRASFANLC